MTETEERVFEPMPTGGFMDVPVMTEWWTTHGAYYIADGIPEIPVPLFHGSRHVFTPGEIVTPRTKRVAHASRSLRTARVFGLGGRVWLVEPVTPVAVDQFWQQKIKYTGGEHHTEHVSTAGFRVIREVGTDETDADFEPERWRLFCSWKQEWGVDWCPACTQYHRPGAHR